MPHLPKPGRYPEFPVRSSGKDRVCAFLQGKAHEVQGTHETQQEIGDMGHPAIGAGIESLQKKSRLRVDSGPQRLKPDLFSINYVRPKGRTLQKPEFFRNL
jgi:hypothetical protein